MKAVFNLAIPPTCLKVLLVEDNPYEAELIADLLSGISNKQQISLTIAERLSEALLRLNRETFDIILLDLSLPDSHGIETVARVQEYGVNVPIVVLTGQNDEELALRLISVGVQDYLIKRKIDGELLIRSLRYAIERQHSQDALRKSEENYRSVVENSPIGIAIFAPVIDCKSWEQCTWIEVNDAVCKLLDYDRKELMQKKWLELTHPDDLSSSIKQLSQILSGAIDSYILDKRWLRKDGEIVYTRVSLRCIRRPDGSIDRMIKVVLDISDRYRYESQLKASEQFLNHTINASPDPIFVKDDRHRWMILNDAFCQLIGKSRQELIGKSDYDFFPKSEADVLWAKDEEVLTTGMAAEIEENFTDGHGKQHIISTKKTVFQNADGSQILVGTIRDITEYRRQQIALEQSEARFQKDDATSGSRGDLIWDGLVMDITELKQAQTERDRFFTISLDLLCIVGFDGYFKRLNPAWSNALGYSNAELLAQPPIDFVHPDDREATIAESQKLIAGNPSIYFENRFLCKDGSYKWLLWTASPFSQEGLIYAVARDITSRKQAESALQRQAVAMDAAYDGIAILNAKEEYIYLNYAYLKMYGIASPSKLFGKSWKMLYSEAELQLFQRQIIPEFQKTEYCYIEAIGKRCDGTQFPQELSMTMLTGGEIICIVRDITRRKEAESALLRVTQAVESTSDAICIADLKGRSIYHNQAFIDRYGYTAAELNTAGGAMTIYPQTKVLLAMFKTIRKGKSWQGEIKILTKSNELVTTLFRADCIKDETGNLIGLVGVMTDITERKQAEIALRQQLKRERLVVAMLDRIRSSLNLEEVLTTAVEEVRQFLQTDRTVIYRFQPDWSGVVVVESVIENRMSLRNLNVDDPCFGEKFVSLYQQGWIRAIEDIYNSDLSECHINFLTRLEVKANLVVPILQTEESIYNARSTAENPLWGLLIAHDCNGPRAWDSSEIESLRQLCVQLAIAIQQSTLFQQAQTEIADRKQAEFALQQAKESAETANRAKSEFLANMSHELRTPLNGVLGYAQILKTDKTLNPDHQESLSNIQHCGQHLLMLIEDILDLSKIEARKMELYPSELNFINFTKNIADLFQMRADQKGISFSYEQVSPLPSGVHVDEKRLRQVLINLLSNAVKFTNSGGVTFKVGYVGTEAWSRGQGKSYEFSLLSSELKQNYMRFAHALSSKNSLKIRFQVEDTGIGIAQSKLEEIFLPFHQVDGNTFVEGTGLGLSISQKLAKLMGSEIRVNSTLGKGSTFWLDLELPAAKHYLEVTPLQEKRWVVGFVGNKRKVLIVDDNQVNRSMLCSLLGRLGFEVAEAQNGQECLHKAVEFQPDVILMDLLMPVMDGLEAARRVRQLSELKDVVLIALSASVFEATQQESMLAGCDDFLPKPIEANHFLEQLRVHLGLKWIYEECSESKKRPTPSLSAASDFPAYSSLLPTAAESVAKLLKLAAIGDIEDFFEEIANLETLEEKLVPLLTCLRQLAKGFQLKQIRNVLKKYIDGN